MSDMEKEGACGCVSWLLGWEKEKSHAVACEFMPKRLTSGACINSIAFANVVVAH